MDDKKPDFTEFFVGRDGWTQTAHNRVVFGDSGWSVRLNLFRDREDYEAYRNGIIQHQGTDLKYVVERVEDMVANAETGETGL